MKAFFPLIIAGALIGCSKSTSDSNFEACILEIQKEGWVIVAEQAPPDITPSTFGGTRKYIVHKKDQPNTLLIINIEYVKKDHFQYSWDTTFIKRKENNENQ